MTTAQLDDRYGRTVNRTRRRVLWASTGVIAALLVGYFGWVTVSTAADSVDVDTTGFEVHDPHSVTITFQYTVRAGAEVVCALEAQDTEHGVVGWRVVEYPASEAHTQRFAETLRTTAEATTGLVTSCWIP